MVHFFMWGIASFSSDTVVVMMNWISEFIFYWTMITIFVAGFFFGVFGV